MPPIVALITDFGTRDHYAGATKGAILAACPEATLVDIAHDLPPHDVAEAAYCLAASYRAFPAGAVFLAVVDPGVGSERRAIAVGGGGYRFVGPDNGILGLVLAELPSPCVHAVTNSALFRRPVSSTFHARDIFAPVAGCLARGVAFEDVGPAIGDPVALAIVPPRQVGESEWEGTVIHTDRFGNLTTNIGGREMGAIFERVGGDPTEIVVALEGVVLPLVTSYSEVSEGEACALVGSSARLEVAVHRDSAARVLGAGPGAKVRVRAVSARG